LNLHNEETNFSSNAFWSCIARVVFPEEGRPENITSGIQHVFMDVDDYAVRSGKEKGSALVKIFH
jgi:hypothetical protein